MKKNKNLKNILWVDFRLDPFFKTKKKKKREESLSFLPQNLSISDKTPIVAHESEKKKRNYPVNDRKGRGRRSRQKGERREFQAKNKIMAICGRDNHPNAFKNVQEVQNKKRKKKGRRRRVPGAWITRSRCGEWKRR